MEVQLYYGQDDWKRSRQSVLKQLVQTSISKHAHASPSKETVPTLDKHPQMDTDELPTPLFCKTQRANHDMVWMKLGKVFFFASCQAKKVARPAREQRRGALMPVRKRCSFIWGAVWEFLKKLKSQLQTLLIWCSSGPHIVMRCMHKKSVLCSCIECPSWCNSLKPKFWKTELGLPRDEQIPLPESQAMFKPRRPQKRICSASFVKKECLKKCWKALKIWIACCSALLNLAFLVHFHSSTGKCQNAITNDDALKNKQCVFMPQSDVLKPWVLRSKKVTGKIKKCCVSLHLLRRGSYYGPT